MTTCRANILEMLTQPAVTVINLKQPMHRFSDECVWIPTVAVSNYFFFTYRNGAKRSRAGPHPEFRKKIFKSERPANLKRTSQTSY